MTKDEFEKRFHENQRYSGRGIDGATAHLPCPFCAAADWIVYRIIDVQTTMGAGATCSECGRSARVVYHESGPTGTVFEMVQTGGDDPPPWAPMRRESEITGVPI